MSSHCSAIVILHHFYSEHITEKWRFGDICRRVSHDLNIHYLLWRHAVSEMAESVKEISTALRPIPVPKRCSLAWGGLFEEFRNYVLHKWVNNCWWGWQNRRDLGKCTHQCDETQGNNSVQAISTKKCLLQLFLVCPLLCFLLFVVVCLSSCTRRRKFAESACALLFPCVSSHWWVHFPWSGLRFAGS